jgi:hypothetical protein
MNSKKPKAVHTTKRETGQPVFGADVDEVLAKKVTDHAKGGGASGRTDNRPSPASREKSAPEGSAFTYRTPEQKRMRKTAGYGIAAFACLFILGAIAVVWSKLRDD